MITKKQLAHNTGKKLNRREVLKTLAAGSGALAAAAFLPSKWSKPVIQAGVLPAHAQASCNITLEFIRVGRCGSCPGGNEAYVHYTPSGSPPTSVNTYYGGLGVPSNLVLDTAGYFYLYFALPGIPTATTILYIEALFENGCKQSAQINYQPANPN